MNRRMVAAVAIAIVAGSEGGPGRALASAADVTAPKLGSLEATPVPTAAGGQDPPLLLPRVVTICRDVAKKRCWSERGESECRAPAHPNARVFHTVASGAEGDPGAALEACWESLRR